MIRGLTLTSMGNVRRGRAGRPSRGEEGVGEDSERIMSNMRAKRCSTVEQWLLVVKALGRGGIKGGEELREGRNTIPQRIFITLTCAKK